MSRSDDGPPQPEQFDTSGWKMFQRIVEDCPVAVFVTDTAGRHLFVNRQWCELTGLAPTQAFGWGWEQAVHPADVRAVIGQWRHLITHGDDLWVRLRVVTPRGSTVTAVMHAVATAGRDGRRRFVGTLTHLGAQASPGPRLVPGFPFDLRQPHLTDPAPWPSLLQEHPEQAAAVARHRRADDTAAATARRSSSIRPPRPPAPRLRPASHETGCDCLFGELLRAEHACHVRERWLATLLDELPAAALLTDANGRVEAVNQAYCDLFELAEAAADLVGTDCRLLLRPLSNVVDDPAGFASRLEELIRRRRPARREGVMFADGRIFERSHVPLTLPDGGSDVSGDGYAGHLWIYVDVTARRILDAETEGLIAD